MEAASVGGLFHFNQACNVAYWHKADNPVAPAFVRFWTKADKGWFSYSLHCLHGRACHLVGPRRNKARIFPKSHNCFILWALLFVYQHSGG